MPIYEYTCKKCGNFEVMQRITEAPLKKCPTCSSKVTKLISQSAFHLKGSGWYMTDYGKNGASNNKTGETTSSSSDSKESKTTESKSTSESTSSPTKGKESSATA